MNKRALGLVALALCLSAAFALLAFYSPVKSLPGIPTCNQSEGLKVTKDTPAQCAAIMKNYKPKTVAEVAGTPVWFYWSYAEIAEGLAVAVVLSLLFMSRRSSFSWLNKPLVPRFPKRLLIVLMLIGASAFVFFAVIDATYRVLSFSPSFVRFFYFKSIQTTGSSFGVAAFVVWGLISFCLFLAKGLTSAMRIFGLPSILFLMILLLIFDSGEMPMHATNFTTWSLSGISIVSNWFVLIVTSSLVVLGLAPLLSKKAGVGR